MPLVSNTYLTNDMPFVFVLPAEYHFYAAFAGQRPFLLVAQCRYVTAMPPSSPFEKKIRCKIWIHLDRQPMQVHRTEATLYLVF
jgi:hypothetical protein